MANFSSADVKRLRDATGAGIMDCRNALRDADGEFEKAVELLRLKGVKDVAKRATGRQLTGSSQRRSTAPAPGSWSN